MSSVDVWNKNMLNDFKKLNNTLEVYDMWLDKYKEYIESSKNTIIDLGCGIGNDTMYIKSFGKEVLSVDYSDEALKIINQNIKDANTLKMDFENEWLLEKDSADLIIANLSLHYFNTKTTFKIIDNIKDTLVNGGILIVRLNSINDTNYGSNSLDEIEPHYYESMNIKKRFFDKDDISFFFSGFKTLICDEKNVLSRVHDKKKVVWECVFKKEVDNMKYEMKLNNGPFMNIKNGTKTIELRLNDEKRQLLKIKDLIEFTNRETSEKMLVEIENLHHYPSFDELYKHFDKVSLGYKEDEIASPKDMEEYYSKEEQEKYGVLGIEIKKL